MSKDSHTLYTLYNEELDQLSYKPSNFLDTLRHRIARKRSLSMDLVYSFSVPVSEYLRAQLFCEDVSEVMEAPFFQRDLISLLFDDFLYQAKKKNSPLDLYHELDIRSEQAIKIVSYGEGESKTFKSNGVQGKTKEITCTIKRKEALRLEVMLSDVAELDKEKSFTVDDVLCIIYRDFIQKYKSGKLTNVIENIIKRLASK